MDDDAGFDDNDFDDDDQASDIDAVDLEGEVEGDDEAGDDFDMDARVGHLSRADIQHLQPEEQLKKWHEMLLPKEVDLISELDATNIFFINAESVICDLLISSGEGSFDEEGQFLRMTFLFEQLLASLQSCGGVFRLIFFDAFKPVFEASFESSLWAFREAFLNHCRANRVDHAVFSHWYAPEWKEHIMTWRPSFFLLADDSLASLGEKDDDEEEEDEDDVKKKGSFQALMLRCLSYRVHVALLHGLQRRGNRVMAFTVEPDNHDSFIDFNVKGALQPLLEEEEEEEEEEKDDILAALKAFQKRAGDKVPPDAMLRCFLLCRFAKNTLALVEAEKGAMSDLLKLAVRVMLIQEMLLRYVPLDKRAFTTVEFNDWGLFSEYLGPILQNKFYPFLAEELGRLNKLDIPEGVQLESCDIFDGRLYGHVLQFVVGVALKSKKSEVKADAFKFGDYVDDELKHLWTETSSNEKFFPMKLAELKDLEGLEPPKLPAILAARKKPVLHQMKSELMSAIWQEEFNFQVTEEEVEEKPQLLFDRYQWKEEVRIDAVLEAQHIERSAAQKAWDEKMRLRGKITDKDREWQRKKEDERRQRALRHLHGYAKSLTGSDALHHPIIKVKSEMAPEELQPREEKISKKQQEIIDKNNAKKEEEKQAADDKQEREWDKSVEALSQDGKDPAKLEKELLDLLIGFQRIMPSFVGFPALQVFKTPEAQVRIITKVVKNLKKVLEKMQLDKLAVELQPKVRSLVVYIYCLLQEAWNTYGRKRLLDGKCIKLFQEVMISLGFPQNARGLFEQWKKVMQPEAEPDEAEAKDKDKKKGGKDDKKDKKKDGKDKKDDKKDQKGKKDDKKNDKDDDLDSFKVTKEVDLVWSGVGDEYAFQLLNMGPQMTRLTGAQKDSRVNFSPDKWQRDLIDIVDSEESALVVAPTASGKTFIGYYVMDKVLRNDHQGVAVYVAPSKALVNQVSAEIYARFGTKIYPAHSKKELLGNFLKEFNSAGGVSEAGKYGWRNCQVLVTVPHILEMLLLSAEFQDWVAQLRYVIFDEVHCIGEQEGGEQWEHCMQLIPCPFIALSATVADPSIFHGWLSRVSKKKHASQVSIVEHKERWNDLYKYVWHKDEMRPLHPFCCLVESSLRRNGMSADLTLVPREMVQLHQEVSKIVGPNAKWDRLAPAKYFAGMAFVTKIDSRKYEKELKGAFLELLTDNSLKSEGFTQLTLSLQQNPELEMGFNPPSRVEEKAPEIDLRTLEKGTSYLQAATLFKLCKDLDSRDIMPAIFFNFSRKEIERMLKKLVDELEKRQYDKYFGDEDAKYRTKKLNERRRAEYEQKKKAFEEAQKMKASAKQESKAARASGENEGRGGNKSEAADTSADLMMVEPVEPMDIADEIDDEFTFHSAKALGVGQEDIEYEISKAAKGCEKWMLVGLRRGIGMHHEGLKKTYRDAVEILFRKGYLRVVFATGTLALGINMPCRSTIFCGDSLELNGLMYRQMSGRAGRRGFDLLGQVIFLDKPFSKIQRLITSDLPTLAGEFTLSPTILLRALYEWETMRQLEEEKALGRPSSEVARCVAPVFTLPFFESKTAELVTQVAYQSRFSLEFLYQEGLIKRDGTTRNLANLCTHLFEAEPANLILVRLLSSGLLHEYLTAEAAKTVKGDRKSHLTVKLASVLGWIFFRLRLPRNVPKRPPRKKFLPSEGCPKLPPLPPRIRKEIQEYNKQLIEIYQQFAYSVAVTRKVGGIDVTLPTSQKSFRYKLDERGEPFDGNDGAFGPEFFGQMVKYKTRSPFSALGGVGDHFRSPVDLCKNCRNVLHLDLNAIPTVANPPGRDGGDLEATNSWLLDYMIHGQRRYLWEDNGINATKAYKLIDEFIQMLKKAHKAFKALAPEKDIVLTTFDALAKELEQLQRKTQKG